MNINLIVAAILNYVRNSVWNYRRQSKGDPFEHTRENYLCFVIKDTNLIDIGRILTEHDYTLNEPMQFEDEGQVLSGHHYYNFVNGIPQRQRHIRVFQLNGTTFEIRSHDEYSWIYSPIKHYNGVDVQNDCDYTRKVFNR